MAFVLILMFGIALIAGPIVAGVLGAELSTLTQLIMTVSGIVLSVLSGILLIITKLYVKTKASEAFVRTGMGGMKVIKDGGALVIPVIHQVLSVSLETLRLVVGRENEDALLTSDKLRVDIRGEFFVKVPPDDAAIKNAARTLGGRMARTDAVKELVEDKLVSALRTVAARRTLEELNSERDKFLEEVQEILKADLEHNGLTLETATISKLDQTNPDSLRDNNVFDAQGKRTIAEIVQAQMTARNELERKGEQARKAQDVQTRQRVLQLEQEQAAAEAAQKSEVEQIQAEKQREAQEKQIEAARQIELASVQKARTVQVAEREQQQAIEVAERHKQQAVTLAEQELEVARRQQQQAIAKAEQERTAAEAELAKAEAEREAERQNIKTVEVTAAAERDKKQRVISAQAEAEQKFVTEQRDADAEAYRVEKQAEAKKAAADAEAEAVIKKANAEREAQVARADGEKAVALVPVDVKAREVEIDRDRVETVLKPELEAREQHGKMAQDFELAKIQVQAEKEVRIAAANATATLVGKVNAQVYGTPEDVTRMAQSLANGIGVATTVNGFLDGVDDNTKALAANVFGLLQNAAASLKKPKPAEASENTPSAKKEDASES